ncbi:MAG: hypothetical protein R2710_23325 [Acidimicrobiales bacterium]
MAIDTNIQAFRIGRKIAIDPDPSHTRSGGARRRRPPSPSSHRDSRR